MEPRRSPVGLSHVDAAELLAALKDALTAAEFTAEHIESVLGAHELSARPVDRTVHRRRLGRSGSFAVLARLLLLGDEVSVPDLDSALQPLGIRGLRELGLCVADRNVARATAKVVPHGDFLLACDLDATLSSRDTFDYVPGVQAPSVTLAKLAVRQRCESALDLGTGLGLQALLAARHCSRVVATDINPRALGFAAFNAQLNRCQNVELRRGTTFEPVADERFDLIVSNPPYVISPDRTYAYRDGEVPGDELCRQIVRDAPGHLREGGFAHILVSWPHDLDGDWDEPLRDWVSGSGCDAWLLHYRTSDRLAHATGWLRPMGREDPIGFEAALDRWLGYLAERGISAVGYGAVILRRRSGARNWVRAEQLPLEHLQPAGDHVLRVFAGNDLLHVGDERALLAERLSLTPRHRIRQTLACHDRGLEIRAATLELTDGLCFSLGIDRYTMLLLPHLDGSRVLADAVEAAAAGLDLTDQARQEFVPAALPVVRRLVELGFLERRSGRP